MLDKGQGRLLLYETEISKLWEWFSRDEWYRRFAETINERVEFMTENEEEQLRTNHERARQKALAMGFSGNVCRDCNHMQMVRNGTCEKCLVCGSTSGCS